MRRRRFLFEWLLMALLLPPVMLWLSDQPGLLEANRSLYDRLLQSDERAAPSPDIVIIGIDERSIAALGPWPWSRTLHAQLLEQLAAHPPRSVMFNVFFDTPGPASEDARLAAAMATLPVYLPVSHAVSPDVAHHGIGTFQGPVPVIAAQARGLGHVDATPDSDDRVRTLYRYEGTAARLAPYIGLLIASGAQDAAPARPAFAPEGGWSRMSRFGFRLAGPAGSYRTVSYLDVLLGSVPPDTFQGKNLLIGAVADSRLNDQLAVMGTGVRGHGLSGVEIHANAIDVLMQGRAIEFPGLPTLWLWIAVPIWAALGLFLFRPRHAGLSALLLGAVVLGAGTVALRDVRVALPLVTPVAGIGAAYLLWSWRRLASVLRFFRQRVDALNAVPAGAFEPAVPPLATLEFDAVEQRTRTLERAIDRLVTLQSMLSESVALMPAAVLICRGDGTIGQGNAAAQALLARAMPAWTESRATGAAADPLVGRDLFALLAPLHRIEVIDVPAVPARPTPAVWHDVMSGEYATAQGDVFRVHAVPLGGHGTAPRWIVVLRDLTAERKLQREREELFAFFSHDLRAPQVAILSLLALHADGRAGVDTDALTGGIAREAQRTLTMADGFMGMMEAASSDYRLAPVPLGAVAMDAIDSAWPEARRRRIRLVPRLHQGEDGEGFVMADGPLLTRALQNLLNNAIRHSADGAEVHVCIALVDASPGQAAELVLAVRDEGEGMDAERLSRAREAGHRRTRSGTVQGWGIGLAVVNTVVARHGGWIEVDSRPGAGSTFLVGLPVCTAAFETGVALSV